MSRREPRPGRRRSFFRDSSGEAPAAAEGRRRPRRRTALPDLQTVLDAFEAPDESDPPWPEEGDFWIDPEEQ